MKSPAFLKTLVVEVICYLYILLFIYAAVSKLTDFQNFRLQIAQSPLLTAYAGFVAVTVLIMEFLISLLLAVPKLKLLGLYAAFMLMTMFSIYIVIILNYSPYIPCSCGGILEDMSWREHLRFNIAFVALATAAIYFKSYEKRVTSFSVHYKLLAIVIVCALTMFVLFITSENIVHHRNNFIRRIPPFAAKKVYQTTLPYNSYYLAGISSDKLYLGNRTAPSIVTEIDTTLQSLLTHRIKLMNGTTELELPIIKISPPYFYVIDNSLATVFRGKLVDWKAYEIVKQVQMFTGIVDVDSTRIIFRAATTKFGNLLGTFNLGPNITVDYHKDLLQKQIDGYFDTDGTMHYNKISKKFIYLYYYRNQFIVTDENLNLKYRGRTIDTTSQAKIKVEYIEKSKRKKFAAPPQMVNRRSALHNNLLFVNSTLQGKYDPEVMVNKASIIDVYNISNKSYVLSFYIYNIESKSLDNFLVNGTHLFAQFGTDIVCYQFDEFLKKEFDNK